MAVDPIFITGLPRSGTSLVTGILAQCGAWVGQTYPPDPHNKKGNFENRAMRQYFLKPILEIMGADPLGLDPLPNRGRSPVIEPQHLRKFVHGLLKEQGWPGVPWAYKDAKLVLCWRQWQYAFPNAKWVVVRRDNQDIIASAMRAVPMANRFNNDWNRCAFWANEYLAHIEDLAAVEPLEVWPQRDIFDGAEGMQRIVAELGLEWDEGKVNEFVEPKLWRGQL